jgi:hypothetical protein
MLVAWRGDDGNTARAALAGRLGLATTASA